MGQYRNEKIDPGDRQDLDGFRRSHEGKGFENGSGMNLLSDRVGLEVFFVHQGQKFRLITENLVNLLPELIEEFSVDLKVPDGRNQEGMFLGAHQAGF
jgi:hypothetical protein